MFNRHLYKFFVLKHIISVRKLHTERPYPQACGNAGIIKDCLRYLLSVNL